GAGPNHGWTLAQAQDPGLAFVWALEHDTIPEPGCLERLLATCGEWTEGRAGRVGAVVPMQVLPGEPVPDPAPGPASHRTLTFNGTLFPTAAIAAAGPI